MCTVDTKLDETVIHANVLHNVRVKLAELRPNEYQQLVGILTKFTAEQCARMHRYLLQRDIRSAQVVVLKNGAMEYRIILANDDAGLQRGIAAAQKSAKRQRARVFVIHSLQ